MVGVGREGFDGVALVEGAGTIRIYEMRRLIMEIR
jgi:hypothetical protein